MRKLKWALPALLALLLKSFGAMAQDASDSTAPKTLGSESQTATGEAGEPGLQTPKKKSRGSRSREKETDGTDAPNRFQPEGVLKSPYHLNGQPLEVDPD